MFNRLEKLVAIAVKPVPQPVESDNILLKVCPRCKAPHSKFDTNCQRCTKKAKRTERILKAIDIAKRINAGTAVSEEEQKFLKDNEKLLGYEVGPEDIALLEQAPFELPEDLIVVRPTFKNRLQFFIDRMRAQNRKITTTYAAAKLLKFENKDDFVNFATDHGVRSLMSADGQQYFAAWKIEDILKLFQERQAYKVTKNLVETEPGKMLTSLEAAVMLQMPGAKSFIDLATEFGVKPAKSFGDKPEQKAWHVADIETLRRIHELDTEAVRMEEAIKRLERDIAILNSKPMKNPDILAWRVKTKDLNVIRNELTKIERLLEQEGRKLQEMAEKRDQAQVPTKKASNHRLVRILSVAANPTIIERKALIDKIYNISDHAVKKLLAEKDLLDLLDNERREQAMEGLLSFDDIMREMLDALNLTPHEGFENRISEDELKRLNTIPNARNCAGCGSPLSDPGMGPKFKHCSKCEP